MSPPMLRRYLMAVAVATLSAASANLCAQSPPTKAGADAHAEQSYRHRADRAQPAEGTHNVPSAPVAAPAQVLPETQKGDGEDAKQKPEPESEKGWGPVEWSAIANACFTGLLFIFTLLLWRETRVTTKIAHMSYGNQFRAFVHAPALNLIYDAIGEMNVFRATLKNYGATPAIITATEWSADLDGRTLEVMADSGGLVLGRGEEAAAQCRIDLLDGTNTQVHNGTAHLTVAVLLQYRDITGDHRSTVERFRFRNTRRGGYGFMRLP